VSAMAAGDGEKSEKEKNSTVVEKIDKKALTP
jgi:hypothetical protein